MHSFRRWLWPALPMAFLTVLVSMASGIRITEIHYHPPGTNVLEEFIELHNTDPSPVNLTGWSLSDGVRFAFPSNTILLAGGRLVVAADPATFRSRHAGFSTALVGGWSGTLDDDGEHLALSDATGTVEAEVNYAPEGDWAVRRLAAPDAYGKVGWEWFAGHNGEGQTLELISETLPQGHPQNWASSTVPGGTPGQPNSVASTNLPPLVSGVTHLPVVPRSGESVAIHARVIDDGSGPVTALLFHRVDGAASFVSASLFDDGAHGDGLAGDGLFGAVLPAQPDGTIVEFYLTVRDAGGQTRTYPAVTPSGNERTANLIYQVSNEAFSGPQPLYRLILNRAENAALRDVWSSQPNSDAVSSGTFVVSDGILNEGTTTQYRYTASFRNRGHGTRVSVPHNFRVNLPKDRPWQGRVGINLNTQYTHSQMLGSMLFRMARVPMAESRAVRVRVNGTDLANAGQPQFGAYAANELVNGAFIERELPGNTRGNLYRGIRDAAPGAPRPDLVWLGPSFSLYTNSYFKQNNTDRNDWADLVHLLDVLANTPDARYVAAVRDAVDVDEWMRYFALNTLMDNQETAIGTGNGDDFVLYSGTTDPRFLLLPYDMDSMLGQGLRTTTYADGLFRMMGPSTHPLPTLERLVKHPEFAPIYYRELKATADTLFVPEAMDPFLDQLARWFTPGAPLDTAIANMKAFNVSHQAYIRSLIPLQLSATSTLPVLSGYPHTTSATSRLEGMANALRTRRVTVNGQEATWSAWEARWTAAGIPLQPGLNRVQIRAFDASDAEFDSMPFDLWYDDGATATAPSSVSGNTLWTAAGGPYLIPSGLTIPANVTLTVEPGTTVYLGAGAGITVASGGRLLAEGTATAPIRFTRAPGSTTAWGGITVLGTSGSPETRITHAHLEFNGTTAIHADGATVFLDHLTFGSPDHQYVSLDNASFVVSHCVFPTPTTGFELAHGTGGIRPGGRGVFLRNFFGRAQGYNDVIDFTGGNRPGPILEVLDNVFTGSGDDVLDLDGTDAWVEGNLFLHVHRNGSPDTSSAVSGGSDGGRVSRVTVLGNLFFDCDQAVTAKQGNFFTLLHNTIVHQTHQGSQDAFTAVVNAGEEGVAPSAGHHVEGNLIHDAEALVRNYDPASSQVVFTNNLLPFDWTGPGGGNLRADPLLRHLPRLSETEFTSWEQAQVLREWFALLPGSPARGAASGGLDLGFLPIGAQLSGAPVGTTASRSASLFVGPLRSGGAIPSAGWPEGAGYPAYRWRLDGGTWSVPIPSTTPIQLTSLAEGPHQVEIVGRRDSGTWQEDERFDELATPTVSRTWIVDPAFVSPAPRGLEINEVLAKNLATFTSGETTPDLIELHNAGTTPVDLAGLGLSDSAANPGKYRFPAGSSLAPGAWLVLIADSDTNVPGLHLGFSLAQDGESVVLTDRLDRGGAVLDAVTFGAQVPDLSIGRRTDGSWGLCQPTFGGPNRAQPTGDPHALRINEWLANARFVVGNDFVELYNPGPLPVALEGLSLSDSPGQPGRETLPPLGFIGAGGCLSFIADGESGRAGHLGFKLASESGTLHLSDPSLAAIDTVAYGPQGTDRSQGRSPSGSATLAFFRQPTPGALNPGSTGGTTTVSHESRTLLGFQSSWRYSANAALPAANWFGVGYDDSAWRLGTGLFGLETSSPFPYPVAISTPLSLTAGATRIKTFYFRTRFDAGTNLAGLSLQATNLLDDGAVFYLNGQRVASLRVSDNPATYASDATNQPDEGQTEVLTLPIDPLVPGENVLAVEVHQSGSSSTDVVFGMALAAIRSTTNTVAGESTPVVLNEILVRNRSRTNTLGQATGWIELHNPSGSPVSLAGVGLSDDPTTPRKWSGPAGLEIAPHGFHTVHLTPLQPATASNAPFTLSPHRGAVWLTESAARGGAVLDVLNYGLQTPDFAVGRIPDGADEWVLTLPGESAANVAAGLGSPSALRINEWMADPVSGADWFELFNSDAAPVALGGLAFTDDLGNRAKSPVPPLSFIGTGPDAFVQFLADNRPADGPVHVAFRLGRTGSPLGVYASSGLQIDALAFGPQGPGISEGRLPDGAPGFVRFPASPSPGAPNTAFTGEVDSDSDGMPDTWESAHGLDPRTNDASLDPDGDGLDNLAEYRAGTDPRNPASLLRLAASVGTDGTVAVSFDGVQGHGYTVQFRTELEGGIWLRLESVPVRVSSGPVMVIDPAASSAARFYRVLTPALP